MIFYANNFYGRSYSSTAECIHIKRDEFSREKLSLTPDHSSVKLSKKNKLVHWVSRQAGTTDIDIDEFQTELGTLTNLVPVQFISGLST